jgi:hypothetical protein
MDRSDGLIVDGLNEWNHGWVEWMDGWIGWIVDGIMGGWMDGWMDWIDCGWNHG